MKYLFFLFLIGLSLTIQAQSFFQPLPKPALIKAHHFGVSLSGATTMNVFRPVANLLSYGITNDNGALLTGAGVSYQHLKWDDASQKWTVIWSINGLAWYAAPLSTDQSTAFAYGASVGILNNLIMVGAAYNGTKFFPTLGIGISLNN